jgi:hypothetical protein
MKRSQLLHAPLWLAAACALASACGSSSNNPGTTTNTGQSCKTVADCYPGIDAGSLMGEALCLTAVPNGYCTHHCTTDMDCCSVAVPGECPNHLAEVCGPFESTGEMDCFLSCEAADLMKANFTDANAYCQKYANATFICRSTGGGSKNRQVCVPNG